MTKTEELYTQLLSLRVVRFEEIVDKARGVIGNTASRGYIYRKYVRRLVKAGKMERVRRGLYVVLSPLESPGEYVADKFLIASKIREEYYLGFHTALEYHGCAQSLFNEVYMCVKAADRFDRFRYGRFYFAPVFVKDTELGVEDRVHRGTVLRVSTKERTFIECVDRVGYVGGWEEALKSLEDLRGLDFKKLADLLENMGKGILVRRVGYVLEFLKGRSPFYEHLEEKLLEGLVQRVSRSPHYLVRGESGPFNERWNLYIPERFEERAVGV